jgi:hypothetical protein
MTDQALLVAQVGASPSTSSSMGAIVGYYLQGSLLLIWAAIGVPWRDVLSARARKPESVEERYRDRRAGALFFPMDQFSSYLIRGDELLDTPADLRLRQAAMVFSV